MAHRSTAPALPPVGKPLKSGAELDPLTREPVVATAHNYRSTLKIIVPCFAEGCWRCMRSRGPGEVVHFVLVPLET